MNRTSRIPALAAALALSTASMMPGMAFAQAAAPAPSAAPAPTAAPATPDTTAQAPGTPAPGTPAPATPAPGTPPAAGTPDANAPAAAAPSPTDANAPSAAASDNGNGTETVANPYGLSALWKSGDIVARSTLVILVIMSFGTWYIMVTKYVEQASIFRASRAAARDFWKTASVRDGVQRLKPTSPFRYIAENGISATEHHDGALTDAIDLHTWVTMSIQRAQDTINSRLQGGLAFLATVGSTAPFVGLFGTVWGIYHALTAIGIAGQASIDKVAGPVGEALIMTAIGLATAVPAVLGYNFLVRRNKAALEKVRNFSSDLHSILLSGSRVNVAPGASAAPAPVAARVA
jgi:biopolymer transport protein ExbB